jgi:hypothetical protein
VTVIARPGRMNNQPDRTNVRLAIFRPIFRREVMSKKRKAAILRTLQRLRKRHSRPLSIPCTNMNFQICLIKTIPAVVQYPD